MTTDTTTALPDPVRIYLSKMQAIPEILPEWKMFFDGCKERKLVVERCTKCGNWQFFPRGQCVACGGAVEAVPCAGRGTVHSFTIARVTRDEHFVPLLPYVVGRIELDEGIYMTGALVAHNIETIAVGNRVGAYFGPVGANETVWVPIWLVEERE